MAETDTSIVPASSVMAPMPAPTATIDEADRHDGGHEGPEHDHQDEQRDQEPDAHVAGVVLGVEEHGVAAELDLQARHLDAGHGVREHRERRLADLALRARRGSSRRTRSGRPPRRCRPRTGRSPTRRGRGSATSVSTASTSARWLSSVSPSSAAKTTRTLPLAASGKPSSSRSRARALWLSGALNCSVKVPPPAGGEEEHGRPSRGPSSRWCARGAWRLPLRCHG